MSQVTSYGRLYTFLLRSLVSFRDTACTNRHFLDANAQWFVSSVSKSFTKTQKGREVIQIFLANSEM